jgi:hypothetical protein
LVGNCQILPPVTVNVTHRDGNRLVAGVIVSGRRERAICFSEQDRHAVAAGLDDGEVEHPVPIEISNCHGGRPRPGTAERKTGPAEHVSLCPRGGSERPG